MNWRNVDWRWVRDWTGRIVVACVPLGTFLYLTAAPVVRPGGAIQTLPTAIGFGLLLGAVVGLLAAAVLAFRSARATADRSGAGRPAGGRGDKRGHRD